MKKQKKIGRKLLSFLLTLALVLGLMPGMGLTAYAAPTETLLTTITATGKEQASYSTDGVATVSFNYTAGGSSTYLANWGWWGYGWTATVNAAEGYTITKCVFYDDANRTATDSEAPFVVETTEEDKTPQVNGTPILAYTSKGIKKIEVYGYATPTATHSVTITAGDHMTKTAGSGDAEQTGLTGAMADVVYTADNGYYYPTDYSAAEVSGIKVTRDSYTQITVSGTPTADAAIALTAPTAKTTPDAPTTATATDCTTADNNDGKLTGVTTAMEYKKSDAAEWTAGTGSDITGLVPGTYYVRIKATDTTLASDNQELTINAAQTQTEELLTTITATGKEQASYNPENVASVSFSYSSGGSSAYLANWGWWGYGWSATVNAAEGYTITKCVFYDDANRKATDSEAPFVVETTEEDKTPQVNGTPILAYTSKGITKIEVYGYATPAPALDPVFYMAWNGTTLAEKTGDDACTDYTVVTADTTTFEDGKWYVVSNSVTVSSRITVTGTVNLILCDGATLTASKGITVNSGNTINIYAQIGGTGELNAGSDTSVASIGGGYRGASSGTVNIHGGKITATGGTNASGIGGALEGGNGEVNIYSGEVTARGKNYAAGIGGYSGKSGGTVNIYGGTVNASGSQYGTTGIGIGGTNPGNCVVHIYGGEVTATSEKAAAGIQGTITIDGGTVTANGGVSDRIDDSSGETYSSNGINGTITVNGGTVTASGGNVTANSYMGAIESYGGTIYACSGISGTVTISGGTVTATGGNVTGDINNYGGTIYACNGVNGTVTISGGTVTATGGSHTGNSSGTTVKEKGFGGSLTLGAGMYLYGGTSANPESDLSNYRAGAGDYTGDRYVYMTVNNVVPHIHSFTYTATGATITAACTAGCDITEGLALTISAPTELTYDGSAKAATLSTGYNTTAFPGEYMIKYYKGANEVEAANVKAAGDYTAKVTVGEATASVDFTIAKATPSIETIPTASAVTYGQKLADSTLTGGTGSVAGGFAWKDSTVAPAVSDSQNTEYDVVFTPTDENYDAAECKVKLTVNKADSAVTTAPTAKTLTYNGSAQSLINAGTASGGTMKYAVTTANQEPAAEAYTFDNTSLPTSTNAGTYYVWYKVVGDANHNDLAATTPVTAEIAKAAINIRAVDKSTKYGSDIAELTYVVNGAYVTGDDLGVTVSTTATNASPMNTYPISISWNNNANYTATLTNGTYTITKADLTVSASGYSGTYDRQAHGISVDVGNSGATVYYGTAELTEQNYSNAGSTTNPTYTDAGTYTVYYYVTATNYDPQPVKGSQTVTIAKANVEVTMPSAATLTYDGSDRALVSGGSVTGGSFAYALGENGTTAPTGDHAWNAGVPTGKNAGTYYVWYKGVGDGNHNDAAPACITVTIGKKAATINANAASKTYGDADPTLTANVNGAVGTEVLQYTLSRAAGENVNNYAITVTVEATANPNYDITVNGNTFTINKKSATITANAASKTYGDADPALTATVTGTVGNDTLNYTLGRTAGENVDGYTITVTANEVDNPNYDITTNNGTFTINKKALTITADSATKVYDTTALTKNSYTNTDLVAGDSIESVTITGSQTTVASSDNVPSAAVIKKSGTDVTANYQITYVNGTLTVTKATTNTVTVDITGWTYGDSANAPTSEASFGANTVTYSYSDAQDGTYTATVPVNAGTWYVKASVAGTADYVAGEATKSFTIAKKALTITADSATKVYDTTALTKNTYTNTALATGDSIESVTITGSQTTAASSANVPSAAVIKKGGTDVIANYEIIYVNGTLTVTQATTNTVTVDITGWTYGDSANAPTSEASFGANTVTYSYSNAQDGTYTQAVPTNAGTWYVKASVAGTDNYVAGEAVTSFTINKKSATITANAASKTYGDADPTLTATVTGTVGNDTLNYTLGRTAGENVDGYTITVTANAADNPNYDITVNSGTFTINKKALTITADSATKVYDTTALTKNSYTNTDLATGDSIESVTITGSQTTVASSANVPSAAVIKKSGTDVTANYEITYENGTLTVTKATTNIVTVDITGWTYGSAANAPTSNANFGADTVVYTYSDKADGAYTATVPMHAGTYYVKAFVAGTDNYVEGSAVKGFTIAKKAATVTADAKSKTYGEEDPALTYVATGLLGSDSLTGTLARAEGETVGTYAITQGTVESNDYDITYVGANLTVNTRAVVVSNILAKDKKHDGNTEATLDYSYVNFENIVAADAGKLTVSAVGTFDDAQIGNDKNVTITGLTLGGEVAANYVLAAQGQQTNATADISNMASTDSTDGHFRTEVKDFQGFKPQVTGLDLELAKSLCTPAELAAYEAGGKLEMELEVGLAGAAMTGDVVELVTNAVKDQKQAKLDGAQYLDITLYKVVNGVRTKVTNLNGKTITIKLSVPGDMENKVWENRRTFYAVRVHSGVATVLAETTSMEIPFSTDLFSVYAIAYADVQVITYDTTKTTATGNNTVTTAVVAPKTDGTDETARTILVFGTAFAMAAIAINVYVFRRRKEEE